MRRFHNKICKTYYILFVIKFLLFVHLMFSIKKNVLVIKACKNDKYLKLVMKNGIKFK